MGSCSSAEGKALRAQDALIHEIEEARRKEQAKDEQRLKQYTGKDAIVLNIQIGRITIDEEDECAAKDIGDDREIEISISPSQALRDVKELTLLALTPGESCPWLLPLPVAVSSS